MRVITLPLSPCRRTDAVDLPECEREVIPETYHGLYRHAAARTGTLVDRIAHVSALFYDVLGAVHAGMTGARLDRGTVP